MRGISRALGRAPQRITAKVNNRSATNSYDEEFDDLALHFELIEKAARGFKKDAAAYREAVQNVLLSEAALGETFHGIFSPLGSERDLTSAFPQSERTIESLPEYHVMLTELQETLSPEAELIEKRFARPLAEFQAVTQAIRKNINKREARLLDYDRRKTAYNKMAKISDRSPQEQKHYYKAEEDFQSAESDYQHFNETLKKELPRFFELAADFMNPLFHSFYFMQLNVMTLTLDHLQAFAQERGYDISLPAMQIQSEYELALGDTLEQVEAMAILKPALGSARVLTENPRATEASRPRLGQSRTESALHRKQSASALSRRTGGAPVLDRKRSEPALHHKNREGMPNRSQTGPVPYQSSKDPPPNRSRSGPTPNREFSTGTTGSSPSGKGNSSVAGKKKPPPPPVPSKKPALRKPGPDFVVALYSYQAQTEGDLSFSAGDRIEVVQKTGSQDDWWTGKVNGAQGIFPGNYVRT